MDQREADSWPNAVRVIRWGDCPDRSLLPMALVTRTYLTDDLDGSEDDVSTVRLALDKVSYEGSSELTGLEATGWRPP
jgi:hypothetical protein